jgi:MFS family permease
MMNTRSPSAGTAVRPRWVLTVTSIAYFMVVLDSLVVVTALPRMQRDLHAGLVALQWTVNSYGIAFAAGIITAAALGDRFGRRRIFTLGLALFTLSSAACALTPDAAALIVARTVQGLGAAVILPLRPCRRSASRGWPHAARCTRAGWNWSSRCWSPASVSRWRCPPCLRPS